MNIVFTKPIHKIMFDIKDQSYFQWPKKMGGYPTKRDVNLRCSYHKDHKHKTKNCKEFLEKLVGQGRLAKYVNNTRKAKKKEAEISDDEEPPKKLDNRLITGVINAIHAVTSKDNLTKKSLRVSIKKA